MARRAPAVERAVGVLNLLAAHPGQRYTLSEIARDLTLNKATLHAILGALTESGYLVRDPVAKSYALGPALVALGNSAVGTFPAAECALPEMQALSDELGLDCVASAAISDEIVILARAGVPRPFGVYIQAGQRLPLAPPLGTVFVAWSEQPVIERWLSKLGSPPKKATVDHFRRAVESVRARGYSVGLEGSRQPRRPRNAATGGSLEEEVRGVRLEEYALIDVDRKQQYFVNHIGAPAFGPDGEVAIALFLIGFTGTVSGAEVERDANRLLQAADRVTKEIQGRAPAR
ncbi:MAG: IclR family transcriptional regulator [Actinomycetota bacterium]